jgi:ADP-heptose:LPS heptosyltransferase
VNRWDIVQYTRGVGVQVLSEGEEKLFPHFLASDKEREYLLADGTMDFVVNGSPRLLKDTGFLVTEEGVFRKDGTPVKQPRGEKNAAVVRYGGIGDMIQMSSILPLLKQQGYHVTLYTWDYGRKVVENDPHIDHFYLQDENQVPNHMAAEFWEHESKKYDKWINLSESVEGTLLAMPDRVQFRWSKELRHKWMNKNYLEMTHDIAGLPHKFNPRFYPTEEEKQWAIEKRKEIGPCIVWSLSGSSVHKSWPYLDTIIARLLMTTGYSVVTMGDKLCQLLEDPWKQEYRVVRTSGEWSVRQSLAFVEHADLLIGTETGLLNAAGSLDLPKVIFLSHSTQENLTKHWKNTFALTGKSPCYPCHTLHTGGFDTCARGEKTGTALCQEMISADQAWQAIQRGLNKMKRAA